VILNWRNTAMALRPLHASMVIIKLSWKLHRSGATMQSVRTLLGQ
jgi:hypothetical protein